MGGGGRSVRGGGLRGDEEVELWVGMKTNYVNMTMT